MGYPSKATGLCHVPVRTGGCKHPHSNSRNHRPRNSHVLNERGHRFLKHQFGLLSATLTAYIYHASKLVGGGEEQAHLSFFSPLTLQKPQPWNISRSCSLLSEKPVGTGYGSGTINYINKLEPASPHLSLVLIFEISLLDIFARQFRDDYDLACRGEANLFPSV